MPALDGGRAGARRGFLRHFPSYRGPLSHGVRQPPRGPHPHGEKMAVFHGFERTTASIYMVGRGEPEGTEFILPIRGLALRDLRFSVPSVVKRS